MMRATACLLAAVLAQSALAADDIENGRRIYREGILPSGAPLQGVRMTGSTVSGAGAACVNCHRRSGMGSVEGVIQVPPVNGRFLFAQREDKALATMDPRSGKRMNQAHAPYDDESLAAAVRRGRNNRGQEMSAFMPRYTLNDAEMKALTAYLGQLSAQWSPGVTAETIRFTTVVTPGVEPERRKALLDMMRTAFTQKNGSTATVSHPSGRRHMTSAAEFVLGTERKWLLDVWELQGPPEEWGAQLDELYRKQPVFAVVSGLSDSTWQPVHDFCEREGVPCWFPSVDLPPPAQGFYPVYFSRGVALEAEVLAAWLKEKGRPSPRRLVQVFRDDYVGRGAAQALRQALNGSGIAVEDRVLSGGGEDALRAALAQTGRKDGVMFWLRPADVAELEKLKPPAVAYFSAALAGGEQGPFPAAWREKTRLVYPCELPDKRRANLDYFHQWLKLRKLELVDEQMQSEVFFALNFLTDTIAEMLDNLYRDYLLERAENMIARREGGKAEEQARARDALRLPEKVLAWRQAAREGAVQGGTTIYPRMSLGVGQRFASKGGYIVRFSSGGGLAADSGWIVPQ